MAPKALLPRTSVVLEGVRPRSPRSSAVALALTSVDKQQLAALGIDQTAAAVAAEPSPRPEVKAMTWAERNMWFGVDQEMTIYAYEVSGGSMLFTDEGTA